MGNVSTSNSGGLNVEEGGECFRSTEDGVFLSKNLVERIIFKGATASLYASPPKDKKASPPEEIEFEVKTECCKQANVNVTQPLVKKKKAEPAPVPTPAPTPPPPPPPPPPSKTAPVKDAGKHDGYCNDCPLREKHVKNVSYCMPYGATVRPVCGELQEALIQCYQDNPDQILNCAQLVRDLRRCVNEPTCSEKEQRDI